MTPFLPDDDRLAAVREALPATAAGIYLGTGSVGPLPSETHRAMAEQADRDLRVGRAGPADIDELYERMDEARGVVAAVLRTEPGAIALTHSRSEALNVALRAIDWRPGDQALTTRGVHGAALGPLLEMGDRSGVEPVVVDLDERDDDEVLEALDAAFAPGTRLICVEHVSATTGALRPIEQIVRWAHDRAALVAVDGAQAVGAIPVDVAGSGVDVYALPAYKWLLGPEGMAAAYVAPSVFDARRLEASGYGRAAVVGMARSIAWLSMYVGLDWVHARGSRLARASRDRLAAIPGVEVLTPVASMATTIAFRVAGWSTDDAFEEISRRSFAIFRTLPNDALRISVAFFNSEEELERFAATVELVAAHTAETIPPRRTLTIIGQDG